MNIEKIPATDSTSDILNVVIEIPAHADPIKYELDKKSSSVWVDRFMNVPMYYPANYGFVPQTLSEDGDPLDVLVITPVPLLIGCVIPSRPLGALDMSDESGRDVKLLAVPKRGMNSGYDQVDSVDQLEKNLIDQIVHFFEHYKKLEKNKWVKVEGWLSSDQMKQEIEKSIKRYKP
ncbi:MAG: inorganic diphosphatase [Chromatiales bacterium]|nr:inorganic diphosphatase [Chromatiales bacterium]